MINGRGQRVAGALLAGAIAWGVPVSIAGANCDEEIRDMERDASIPMASENAPSFKLIHVVKMPVVSEFGYRGQMGDIIELNDGRLLMAYRGGWWGGKKRAHLRPNL